MFTNIFRILADKLEYFTLGTVKKDEWMNQSMNQLGGEGHHKCGMYEFLLGWCLLTPSSEIMITEQVLSKLKDW